MILLDACVLSAAQWSSRSVELRQTHWSPVLISAACVGLHSLRALDNKWRAELWRPNKIKAQSLANDMLPGLLRQQLEILLNKMCVDFNYKYHNRFQL